ncbi:MAG: transcriptional repressor [Gammaproteobacteria bacterium]|nr:transcriptional repressor [Gammaproteobacteria bacterium]
MHTISPSSHGNIDVIELLKAVGINPTYQRLQIAQILLARPQHLSAEQVLTIVNSHGGAVSKATVYNTLGLFASRGLLREVIIDPNKVFYDSNVAPHHHFFNVDTGTLTDIDPAQVVVEKIPALPVGTTADGVDVIIRIRQSSD